MNIAIKRLNKELKQINSENEFQIKKEDDLSIVGIITIPDNAKNNAGKIFKIRLIASRNYPFLSFKVFVNDDPLSEIDDVEYFRDIEHKSDSVLQLKYKLDEHGWKNWSSRYTLIEVFNIIKYTLSQKKKRC